MCREERSGETQKRCSHRCPIVSWGRESVEVCRSLSIWEKGMNCNPSFYPKHLARQYVDWNKDQDEVGQQVLLAAPASSPLRSTSDISSNGRWDHNNSNSSTITPPPARLEQVQHSNIVSPDMGESNINDVSNSKASNDKVFGGLSQPFISAMEKLFNVLDFNQNGLVHFNDIAENWSPATATTANSKLPPGILSSLKKVATPDGNLTFERFCAGLKIAILRHEASRYRQSSNELDSTELFHSNWERGGTERPNFSLLSRTSSMPILPDGDANSPTNSDEVASYCDPPVIGSGVEDISLSPNIRKSAPPRSPAEDAAPSTSHRVFPGLAPQQAPPKPPRVMSAIFGQPPPNLSVAAAGKLGGSTASLPAVVAEHVHDDSEHKIREPEFIWKAPPAHHAFVKPPPAVPLASRKSGHTSHNNFNPRRHTLQGGVDVTVVRGFEQLEQEKEVLEEGLAMVEKTKAGFLARLNEVNQRLLSLPVSSLSALESNQERLVVEMKSIGEIRDLNRRLEGIANGRSCTAPTPDDDQPQDPQGRAASFEMARRIERLKEQNRMLTEEISHQSHRVTVLEQDKRALIKQLFTKPSSADSITSNFSSALKS